MLRKPWTLLTLPTRVRVPLVGNPFINHGLSLLFPTRSLNELRVLLLDSHRHSRDMERDLERDLGREVHKAEWRVKEQKLQEDIKTLRDKLLLLVKRVWL